MGAAPKLHEHAALRAAFVRVIEALRELADELDRVGLRAFGTGALNAGREFSALMANALQRLERAANDNQPRTDTWESSAG